MNNYAGFWLRFVALIIDAIIISVVMSVIAIPILGAVGIQIAGMSSVDTSNAEDVTAMVAALIAAMSLYLLVATIVQVLYFTLMESSGKQGTIGKIVLGIKVTDQSGNKLDFGKALLRNLGKIISGMILYIGYLMAGFTEKKQALHDIIAGTLVVKK